MTTTHLKDQPEFIAASALAERIDAEIVKTKSRIADIESALVLEAGGPPRDPLADAEATLNGNPISDSVFIEIARTRAGLNTLTAASKLAHRRIADTRLKLSEAYMLGQAPRVLASVAKLHAAMQSVLDSEPDFAAIRTDATALGFDSHRGGMPVDLCLPMLEAFDTLLPAVRYVHEELADRLDTKPLPTMHVRALVDIEGTKSGNTTTMPGKTAKLYARHGKVEILTNTQHLQKARA